ncbi:hypothetical protein PRVXH_001757 [Proteinivorax hydrogeniformans]|uniref:ABC-2 type transport system permease protein n=1 Tax=Proteinivorax hydrogeniformans TaxID=1826727 RepID=A0AAU8HQL5_9FIRM
MSNSLFSNTLKLCRLNLRRDRIRIPLWILAITLTTLIIAPAFTELFSTEQEIQLMAETMKNPAMSAMVGPGFDLDNYTYGGMMAHMMLLFTAIAVAIMSIMLVTRHTRADEEEGRIEMVRSLPVGRLSNLAATLLVMTLVNILLALLVGGGLSALGVETMDVAGSMLYGAVLGVTGIFFAAVTALFAQLSSNNRSAMGYSFAFLLIAYLIRAVGDGGVDTISWFSPLGWVTQTQVYVNNYWWPLFITLAVAGFIAAVALYLNSIRDLEAGFIAAKPGRKGASRFLQGPLGLGLRLQRTAIISWAIGMFVLGATYGSVLGDLETFIEGNEMYRQLLPEGADHLSLTEQFLTMLMAVISIIGTIPALMLILKVKGEENKNRTEHLLARAVSRNNIMGSYLAISVVSAPFMVILSALGLWLAGSAVMEVAIPLRTIIESGMVYVPAMWVMIGLATLLIGVATQATGVTWVYLVYTFFVVYLGELLQVPQWMVNLTPFGNVPQIPADDMNVGKLLALIVIAICLMVGGLNGYNRRDIKG